MTMLGTFCAVDSHNASAVYIASDSRISWVNPQNGKIVKTDDNVQKLFACKKPVVLGFSGDARIGSQLIHELIDWIDRKNFFPETATSLDKAKLVLGFLDKKREQISPSLFGHCDVIFLVREKTWPEH